MQIAGALRTLHALADGVDPHTGEVLPNDSAYQHPDTLRALYMAILELEKLRAKQNTEQLPGRAGMPWDKQEDSKLCRGFDSGKSIKRLSILHERTEGAIRSRLIKHGKITV